jgi:hypothetical protein
MYIVYYMLHNIILRIAFSSEEFVLYYFKRLFLYYNLNGHKYCFSHFYYYEYYNNNNNDYYFYYYYYYYNKCSFYYYCNCCESINTSLFRWRNFGYSETSRLNLNLQLCFEPRPQS